MSILTRRSFCKQLLGLLGTTALNGGWQASRADGEERVRLGYLPITDASPLLVAHANGYFTDEGLASNEPVKLRSWSNLAESFLVEKLNLTHMLLPMPIWMRYNRQVPIKVLAWAHTNGSAVTVRGDTGINGFADLAGRQIAVPYWYSMHNVILQQGLHKVGLQAVIQSQSAPLRRDQVNLFILPPPEMPAALAARKIDGFIVAEPYNALSEIKIGARIMRFTGDMWQNHPCCVIVMNQHLIERRPVFTQKVINALVRAQLWITEHPLETAKLLGRQGKGYIPVETEVLTRVFSGYNLSSYGPGNNPQAIRHGDWPVKRIGFQPYPYPSATRFIVERMGQTVMEGDSTFLAKLKPDDVAKDLVDDRFVKKAIAVVGGVEKFGLIDLAHPWQREEVIEI